ncbi:hypothetical protein AB0O75_26885 [Streptomyces sp. NPDC088921]|uniref:hypothetical protein n=1 Tax=unclassified Streptomyces TaxID=2593676 RepID=UPI0034493524
MTLTQQFARVTPEYDSDGDIGFRDHDEVYDGLADPPRLLGPTAVADIAQGLDAIDVGALLAGLGASPAAAAAVCGFGPEFGGDVPSYGGAAHAKGVWSSGARAPEIRDQSHTFCVAVR